MGALNLLVSVLAAYLLGGCAAPKRVERVVSYDELKDTFIVNEPIGRTGYFLEEMCQEISCVEIKADGLNRLFSKRDFKEFDADSNKVIDSGELDKAFSSRWPGYSGIDYQKGRTPVVHVK